MGGVAVQGGAFLSSEQMAGKHLPRASPFPPEVEGPGRGAERSVAHSGNAASGGTSLAGRGVCATFITIDTVVK